MAKTKSDIVTRALRKIGVCGIEDAPEAGDAANATAVLEALFPQIKAEQGFTFTWSLNETPEAAFLPLAYLLASEIASDYGKQGPSYSRSMASLRAYAFPDDRPLRADLDEDGTVTDDEAEADKRAQYY